jgi:tRNA-(ms[2]io[6]A)-hydroxylase
MLTLAAATREGWVAEALASLDDVLIDHAHCEKKAAGGALKLLFSYPQHGFLQAPLSRLAREELAHFEEVLRWLQQRGISFGRQRPSAYGGRLHAHVRPREPQRLLDLLLIHALIEARSCERFGLLADAVPDETLAGRFRGLLAAEARHHSVYIGLGRRLVPEEALQERLTALAEREAEALAAPAPDVRLHS